ncbi:iron transporter [Vibrio cholerae]
MVAVVVFEFSGLRCQPLRRALSLLLYIGGKCQKSISQF